ncbi:hypothetical protein CDAR_239971 [Caerostris darwini]|uniref:Uncharacterized protein n=1 Tax=Caerostris darwini TaxID=1538125 RepID=A0AAV4T4L6_9ARAC|nr:hypothetical protein CDAR_239971 [Caerostris darwini]
MSPWWPPRPSLSLRDFGGTSFTREIEPFIRPANTSPSVYTRACSRALKVTTQRWSSPYSSGDKGSLDHPAVGDSQTAQYPARVSKDGSSIIWVHLSYGGDWCRMFAYVTAFGFYRKGAATY